MGRALLRPKITELPEVLASALMITATEQMKFSNPSRQRPGPLCNDTYVFASILSTQSDRLSPGEAGPVH
jgi:hypothetical protein